MSMEKFSRPPCTSTTEYPSPEMILAGEVTPGRCGKLSAPRRKKTLWRSNKAAGQERVWCMASQKHKTVNAKERPLNCCNSPTARRVSENTA